MSARHIESSLVHAGAPKRGPGRPGVEAIFTSTIYGYEEGGSYADVLYPRLSNLPNHLGLERQLKELEGGEAALVCSSGMSAITTSLITVLEGGGTVLFDEGLYGGTQSFLAQKLGGLGMRAHRIDLEKPETWEESVDADTRAIYVESITNPTMRVADHQAVVNFATQRGLVSLVDNTFCTPLGFRPLDLGYDLVLHSATKYLNGHSDLAAGAIVGSRELVDRIRDHQAHLGGSLGAHACYLLTRGIKTLGLRFPRQCESALTIARFLEGRHEVRRVHHPFLESHKDHARAMELFQHGTGMLSFELESGEAALRFAAGLRLFLHSASLGGVESLATIPARTSHASLSPEQRARAGVVDGLVRLSAGIEHVDDLCEDIDQALASRRG